jgi:hypothetical protein
MLWDAGYRVLGQLTALGVKDLAVETRSICC